MSPKWTKEYLKNITVTLDSEEYGAKNKVGLKADAVLLCAQRRLGLPLPMLMTAPKHRSSSLIRAKFRDFSRHFRVLGIREK